MTDEQRASLHRFAYDPLEARRAREEFLAAIGARDDVARSERHVAALKRLVLSALAKRAPLPSDPSDPEPR